MISIWKIRSKVRYLLSEGKNIMDKWNSFKRKQLNETTLNRIKSNIEQTKRSFIIMSADRHERSNTQNLRHYRMLQKAARSEGFSFAKLRGGWQEKSEDGNLTEVVENSLIIYDDSDDASELFEFGKRQAAAFNQEAFIFGRKLPVTAEMSIAAYDYQGNRVSEDWAGPWSSVKAVNADAPFWSKVRGSKFQLTESKEPEWTSVPTSWIDAFKKIRSGKRWF